MLPVLLLVSCSKKEKLPTLPTPAPVTDARTILLKTVAEQSMPLQYKFVYDAEHYVTEINYANGFSIYNVMYENKRVKKVTNNWSRSYLLYQYQNGLVTHIDEFDSADHKLEDYQLQYNNAGKLTELTRKNYREDAAGVLYKKEKMIYHADGNLARLEQYLLNNGTLKLMLAKDYSGYDNNTNIDDFYKLHGFLETFVFLPQVKLQVNNPRKEIVTTEANTFEITYSYEFSNQLPVKKTGDMIQTRGNGNGQVFHFVNRYSYY